MDNITIDFNDAIYKATGIQAASVAIRETTVKGEDGTLCRLSVTKRHVGGKISFYIALKDSRGENLLDLQTHWAGQYFTIDKAKSQDAVVIENVDDVKLLRSIELHSTQGKVSVLLKIKLEKPLPSAPLKGERKHMAQIKKTRRM